jgi:hypothetical protein
MEILTLTRTRTIIHGRGLRCVNITGFSFAALLPGRERRPAGGFLPGVFVLADDPAEAKHLRMSHPLDFPVV